MSEIAFAPTLQDPPPRQRGKGAGRPIGPAKQLAIANPGRWVLARVREGRKAGHGMLDSAADWQVCMRWQDGAEFGVTGTVTCTYIKFGGDAA